MYNKKGFTLVEILAVIAIIAVLAIAATVGVTSMLQKQRQKLAYTAEENISEAAQSYFSNKNVNYMKSCTDASGAFITISQKNIDDANKFLRDTKFAGRTGENLYQLYKSYSINGNSDPANKYELDPYIKVKNRACYKIITVGELIEQGLINDADGMCNKSSMVIVYRKADAKNTAGIMTSVQEDGICKSNRKTESGPVVTISPPSNLSLSSSKNIDVIVTTETTKLKSSFTMQYGWSKDKMIKPTSWSNLNFSGNSEKKGSATINVSTLNETRYLWIKAGTVLDNKNNKTSNMTAGPYGFLPTVFVKYDVNTGDAASCPTSKTVVFSKAYGKDINGNEAKLCTPTKTGYDFKGWYRDGTKLITDSTTVDIKLDHTLVAKWEPHIYTITLDKNLATNTPTSSIKVTFDSTTLNPSNITVPIRKYTVSGFGLADARKSNGATVSSTNSLTSTYAFNGWTTTKDGSTVLLSNSSTPVLQANVSGYTNASSQWKKASDITAYAKWTSAAVTLPTITKSGYTCGWTTSSTGTTITNNSGSSYTPTSTITMYGVCRACTYTIAFNKNNASATGSTANKSCTYDENCTLTNNGFSLSGYTFNGWNTTSNKTGTNYANGATVKKLSTGCPGSVNLYANWCQNCATVSNGSCSLNANTAGTCTYTTSCNNGYYISAGSNTRNPTCTATSYSITYTLNGGTNNASNPSSYTIESNDITIQNPTRSSYTFMGWSGSNGTTPTKNPKITKGSTGNKSFTAHWCQSCSTSGGASCSVSLNSSGTCTYTTSCPTGYTISNNGKYNPSCTASCKKPSISATVQGREWTNSKGEKGICECNSEHSGKEDALNVDFKYTFTITDACTTSGSFSGEICYQRAGPGHYNPGEILCEKHSHAIYSLGHDDVVACTGELCGGVRSGHVCFQSQSKWYYYRSINYAYAQVCNKASITYPISDQDVDSCDWVTKGPGSQYNGVFIYSQ